MTTHWTYMRNVGGHKAFECDNEGHITRGFDNLGPVAAIGERLTPGGVVPAGECPRCGALAYPVDSDTGGDYDQPDRYDVDAWTHAARIMEERP